MKKLVYDVGVNDVKKCEKKIYDTWRSMLRRCYSSKYQEKKPTYTGCFVCSEWLTLSNFRNWMQQSNYKSGLQLDKDIINKNNKEYSPSNCSFVPARVNLLITDCGAARGVWPIGVCFHKRDQKYKATIQINGKPKHLGLFSTPEQAHESYKIEKLTYMKVVAQEELAAGNITQEVYESLINWEV